MDDEKEILQATSDLLLRIVEDNHVVPEDICSVFVTTTEDLTSAFPAKAIRQLEGWELVPLMCSLEIPVKPSLPRCIRLMVHINTDKSQKEIRHVYLNDARVLRPDIAG
ncbi:Chorismate mutase AroH [compost metagenome]